MDFFEHQAVARRKTGRLVVLFLLAVVGIIVSTYLVVAVALVMAQQGLDAPELWRLALDPLLILGIAVAVTLLVGGGTVYKLAELRGGGRVVAESVGGRLLYPGTTDPVEQRVLNVVEEMAIAAGTTVPPVYFMDKEQGINAFAAGYEPGDAVIGVTRGTAEQLSRDELQGVIAHEFSHILNGDMRLNIRLIGLLHGILVIGMVGYFILRSSFYLGGGSRRSRGGGVAAILARPSSATSSRLR
jgi:Zn-dependent protease with chaperone function